MKPLAHPMIGLDPPTVDTLAAITRARFIQYARFAVEDIRAGNHPRAAFFLGVASGQVSVLYDINYRGSYALLTLVNRLERMTGVAS